MKTSGLSALACRTEAPAISWLMHLTLTHPNLVSLAAGFTDNESLPVGDVRVLLDEILHSRSGGQPALQYGSTQGDAALRRLTGAYTAQLDGASPSARAYGAKRMLVTNGSQQMLYIATEALCDPGDIVLVEDPTYFVYLGILQSRGVRARAVRLQRDGLDVEALDRTLRSLQRRGELKRVKLLYLVSYFQNPTGVTTSFAKKREALRVLKRYERVAGHPIYLLEDAAYRELRFAGEDVKSALAIPGAVGRVIYAGTYSKPFATGTRVGFGFLPEPVFTAAVRIKGNHDFGTSNLLQQLLAKALASGRYRKHVGQLRRRYAAKAKRMHDALKRHFPSGVELWEPEGGLYFWARLPRSINAGVKSKLFQQALAKDVLYVPGELCYAGDPTRPKPANEIRLSFGGAPDRDLGKGVALLGAVLRRALSS